MPTLSRNYLATKRIISTWIFYYGYCIRNACSIAHPKRNSIKFFIVLSSKDISGIVNIA